MFLEPRLTSRSVVESSAGIDQDVTSGGVRKRGLYGTATSRKRLSIGTVIATAILSLALSGPRPQSQNQPDWRTLAISYDAGEYESVSAALNAALASPLAVVRFARDADKSTTGLRDDVAASFFLEAAMASYAHDPNGALGLIEKGRSRIKGARRDVELAWHEAAAAWLQGPYPSGASAAGLRTSLGMPGGLKLDVVLSRGDDYLKHRDDWVMTDGTSKDIFAPMFLEHALRRFPDSWNLQFARAVFDAKSVFDYLKTYALVLQAPLPNDTRFRFAHSDARNLADSFASVAARAPEQDRPRANLYLGFLRYYDIHPKEGFHLRPEEALPLWREAAKSKDPDVVYVALILQASVLWRHQGQVATAVDELQEARRLFPDAQTAPRLLASLLYLSGNVDAAGAIISQVLDTTPGDDPWVRFLRGDFNRWRSRLAALRGMLK